MQGCSGAAVMGSLQQPICAKGTRFPAQGFGVHGFPSHVRLNMLKPGRFPYIEASLVTGTPPSSVSVPEIGGTHVV